MIDLKKLRIDNYIHEINQVTGKPHLTKVSIFILEAVEMAPDAFEGIALTPEVLEKCGFEKHEDAALWRKYNFYLRKYWIPENSWRFQYKEYESTTIQHLHQLQNLYFALTGEELDVSLLMAKPVH